MSTLSAAVVAAYGPAAMTSHAIRELRKQLGTSMPIYAYAGNRAGRDALAGQQGAELIDAVGADGLRAALERCGDGLVLLTHDDVLLGPRVAVRMLAAHRPGRIVIPFVNAPSTDHDLGSLVHEQDIPRALERAARTQSEGRPVRRVQPSLLLGERERLLTEGVRRHIMAIGVAVDTVGMEYYAAAGAVAAHAGQCRHREVPPHELQGRPLLAATLIVRDEEHMLPDCLASLEGLVDEIVVCDTGSVDRTIEVAQSFGARVEHREWRNDFAWARNQAIEMAGDAWYVLVVDADERVECPDPEAVRRTLAQGLDEHASYDVLVANAVMGREVDTTFHGVRVFRTDRYRYVGAVHEQPLLMPGHHFVNRSMLAGLRVFHLGYDDAVVTTKDKGERNLEIARAAFETEGGPERALHYARSLLAVGRERERQRELLEYVLDSKTSPSLASYTLMLLAEFDIDDGELERAFERAARALEVTPADDIAALTFARAAEKLDRLQDVADKARWRRNRPSAPPLHVSPPLAAKALSLEAAARARTGDLDGALADAHAAIRAYPTHFTAWADVIEALAAERPDQLADLLTPLVIDAGGDCLREIVRLIPPADTAELAARMVDAQTCTALSVETGLIAAVLRQDDDVAARFLPRLDLLDPVVIERIASKARDRGMAGLASQLERALPSRDQHQTPLAERAGRTVLFLELTERGEDERILPAVDRCAEALAAAGCTVVRHATDFDSPYALARAGDRVLPLADAAGLVQSLRPEVVVFASMRRFNRDARALLSHPDARSMLLVPASPIGQGDLVDAVVHPDDVDAADVLMALVEERQAVHPPEPAVIPPAAEEAGLLSVVVRADQRDELVDRSLAALAAHTAQPYEVLLVGGAEAPADGDGVVRALPDTGLGVAADLNAAIAASRGEFVCLLRPGVEVQEQWLPPLLVALGKPGTGAAGPRFDHVRGMQALASAPRREAPLDERRASALVWRAAVSGRDWRAPRLSGDCLVLPRRVLVDVGGLDPWDGDDELQADELCDRLRLRGLGLRVADGSVVLHDAPPPPARPGGLGALTRAAMRRYGHTRGQGSVLATALILSDGQAAPSRATVQQALQVADRVVVLERGDLEATELAVAGLMPGLVEARWMDWEAETGLPELLKELDCESLLVLGAGESLAMDSWEAARAELESLPPGPVRLRIGEAGAEVRVHPPTPDALGFIGGADGPVAEAIAVTPA